nr:thermonuclease family protein [Nannocystis sp.]
MSRASGPRIGLLAALAVLLACESGTADTDADTSTTERCGPSKATVQDVIDGDTIVLASGEKVRYLLVDAPEITNGKSDCYGQEAYQYNRDLVLGQEIALTYDEQCTDKYGRLLAFVEAPDGELNTLLIDRGFACYLYIPPDGAARASEFENLELGAHQALRGMWGVCPDVACD